MRENYKSLALVIVIWLLIGASLSQSGCSPETKELSKESTMDMVNRAVTVGNHTWLSIDCRSTGPRGNQDGFINSKAQSVLSFLHLFECSHPEYEITGWRLEIRHDSYLYDATIFGIWVDHKVRPGYVEEYQAGGYPTGRYIKQEEVKQ